MSRLVHGRGLGSFVHIGRAGERDSGATEKCISLRRSSEFFVNMKLLSGEVPTTCLRESNKEESKKS